MSDHTDRDSFSDSADLYQACCSDNLELQEQAYTVLWRYLHNIASFMTRNQPNASDFADDCAQIALIRIHKRIDECREPSAFRSWSRQIVSRITIDELRRRKHLVILSEGDLAPAVMHNHVSSPETSVVRLTMLAELRQLLEIAPISERSRRTVIGRYVDDTPDEQLAEVESKLSGTEVQPSHVQVTRSKNLSKLKRWDRLKSLLLER